MEHHNLDTHPIPKESKPLFINEPWLIDSSLQWRQELFYDLAPLDDPDNIRVYVPLDICNESILRRLGEVISQRGAATEANESDYIYDVLSLIAQIEIYDQVWFTRHMPKQGKHSVEAIELVKEFIETVKDQNEPMEYGGDCV